MEITTRLTNIETIIADKKAESSRLEGTLEPVKKELETLCGTTDSFKIQEIISFKEANAKIAKEAIEKELLDIETKLGI